MNAYMNQVADILAGCSFLAIAVFAVWHGRTAWRATAMGKQTMAQTLAVFLMLGLISFQRLTGISLIEDAPWIRVIVYGYVFSWLTWRLVLFIQIRRRHTREG